MKVVFTRDVDRVAEAGDVKDVSDGYARNYLLPRGLALAATPGQLKQLEAQRQAEQRRVEKRRAELEQMAKTIDATTLQFTLKMGGQKRVFGTITPQDIADRLKKEHDLDVDRHKLELKEPIRGLGTHEVGVHLGGGINATLKVVVTEGA